MSHEVPLPLQMTLIAVQAEACWKSANACAGRGQISTRNTVKHVDFNFFPKTCAIASGAFQKHTSHQEERRCDESAK